MPTTKKVNRRKPGPKPLLTPEQKRERERLRSRKRRLQLKAESASPSGGGPEVVAVGQASSRQSLRQHPDLAQADIEVFRKIAVEKAKRAVEGLALYRPLPEQEKFHRSAADERLARGSNRGGKTLCSAAEVASAVTGQPIITAAGDRLVNDYPRADGLWFCIGINNDHIGKTMYRKLFERGAYRVIRDEQTRAWRAWNPNDPSDAARKADSRPSMPLIPKRFVAEIAWENKKAKVPKVVRLRNGWEIWFFSAHANPAQGDAIDGGWIDEEIPDGYYSELRFRCIDRNGRTIWSATPQVGNEEIYALHQRAEEEADAAEPAVEEFLLLMDENKFISDRGKARVDAACLTDEERRVRMRGEYLHESFRVFHTFDVSVHGIDLESVPDNWCRFLFIDPGFTTSAGLFAAVPPDDSMWLLYDEIYLKNASAKAFAKAVYQKTVLDRVQTIQQWWMDNRMGRQTQAGSGVTVMQHYVEAFRELGLKSVTNGSSFSFASDDVIGGLAAVRQALEVRPTGTPLVRVLRGRLPNFIAETKGYHKARINGVITDTPVKRKDHLMDCWRYLCSARPKYVAPPRPAGETYVFDMMRQLDAKFGTGGRQSVVLG